MLCVFYFSMREIKTNLEHKQKKLTKNYHTFFHCHNFSKFPDCSWKKLLIFGGE